MYHLFVIICCGLCFEHLIFGFWICLGFRASNFGFIPYPAGETVKHLSTLIVIMTCVCLATSSAWAGAWCMQEGAFYSKLAYNYYFTVDTFDDDGHKHRNPNGSSFRDENITWYSEYGLFDNFTLFASVPYKMLYSRVKNIERVGDAKRLQSTSERYDGLGDLDVGFRYGLLKEPLVLSLQLLTKAAWFYDGDEEVPPGNNQNDYELKLLAGKSLWPFPGYCGLELGYRWRTSAPSDEYRYLLEFGMNGQRARQSADSVRPRAELVHRSLGRSIDARVTDQTEVTVGGVHPHLTPIDAHLHAGENLLHGLVVEIKIVRPEHLLSVGESLDAAGHGIIGIVEIHIRLLERDWHIISDETPSRLIRFGVITWNEW